MHCYRPSRCVMVSSLLPQVISRASTARAAAAAAGQMFGAAAWAWLMGAHTTGLCGCDGATCCDSMGMTFAMGGRWVGHSCTQSSATWTHVAAFASSAPVQSLRIAGSMRSWLRPASQSPHA